MLETVFAQVISSFIMRLLSPIANLLHRRKPDGWCREHRVQADFRGVRVGAEEPNWYCSYGQHYVNRQGREYKPSSAEKAIGWGLIGAAIGFLFGRRHS